MSSRPARVRVMQIQARDYLRVEIHPESRRAPAYYIPATNYRDSEVVTVKQVGRAGPDHPPGRPWQLAVQRGNGQVLIAWFSGQTTQMVGPAHRHLRGAPSK